MCQKVPFTVKPAKNVWNTKTSTSFFPKTWGLKTLQRFRNQNIWTFTWHICTFRNRGSIRKATFCHIKADRAGSDCSVWGVSLKRFRFWSTEPWSSLKALFSDKRCRKWPSVWGHPAGNDLRVQTWRGPPRSGASVFFLYGFPDNQSL